MNFMADNILELVKAGITTSDEFIKQTSFVI